MVNGIWKHLQCNLHILYFTIEFLHYVLHAPYWNSFKPRLNYKKNKKNSELYYKWNYWLAPVLYVSSKLLGFIHKCYIPINIEISTRVQETKVSNHEYYELRHKNTHINIIYTCTFVVFLSQFCLIIGLNSGPFWKFFVSSLTYARIMCYFQF